jgi:hypothetical protein
MKIHNWVNTALIVVVFIVGLVGGNQSSPVSSILGGTTNFDTLDVSDGYQVDGTSVINGSGAAVFSADSGFGTTSPSDLLHVEDSSATTTLLISSGGSAVGGQIILEDHDGAGCSEIVILNGTVASKTVACPTGI